MDDVYHCAIGNSNARALHLINTTFEYSESGLKFCFTDAQDNIVALLPWADLLRVSGIRKKTQGYDLIVIQWSRNENTKELTAYCDRYSITSN